MVEKYIKLSDAEAVISRLCEKCGNDEMAFALNWAGKLLKDIPAMDVEQNSVAAAERMLKEAAT